MFISSNADKIILFLSDGRPTEKDEGLGAEVEILRVISEENAKLNNSVIILTYGVGQNEGEYNLSYLSGTTQTCVISQNKVWPQNYPCSLID